MTGAAARLTGTGRLADDLYLMAHDDVTGRPYLQPRATGLGLAGALLAELMLTGQVSVGPAGVALTPVALTGYGWDGDQLSGRVLSHLAAEHEQHRAMAWLAFLARTAAADVAGRLGQSGYLTRRPARRPWRGERWIPADSDCAFAPFGRARSALNPARQLLMPGAALAGLATACGLGPRLLSCAPSSPRRVEEAVALLPPGLRYLIAQTQAAVDSAVLAHRA